MTTLRQALADYLRIRRGLGFKLKADQRNLENFVTIQVAGARRSRARGGQRIWPLVKRPMGRCRQTVAWWDDRLAGGPSRVMSALGAAATALRR